jgi:uncharacterized phage protein gp47/JayE
MGYIRIPINVDPTDLAQEVFDYITSQAPGWEPQDGNLDVWIVRAMAQLAAETKTLASDVQDDIFRWFGATLVGLQPLDAIAATGSTTWTLADSLGHTIPSGTAVGIADADGVIQSFLVDTDVTVANGQTATGSGAVLVRAVIPGVGSSALGGVSAPMQLIDVIDWVSTVVLTAATSGGQDAETDANYLARLADRMRRLSTRPILPDDFAVMARDADTSITRAIAIDGYDPAAGGSYNNQRELSVAALDANGAGVSSGIKSKIDALLQANREVNFIVNVIDPHTTTVNINGTVVVRTGYDATTVTATANAAVTAYLQPYNWGQDPTVRESSVASTWVETATLYYNNVLALISSVDGVDHVTALTLNGGSGNITLTTPAALTTPGTINVHT